MSVNYVSGELTKVYKCRKKIKLYLSDINININDDEQQEIYFFWNQMIKKNQALFNGEVLNIYKIEHKDDCIHIFLNITDYAHLTFVMNHQNENVIGCKSIASGGLLLTKDDYFILCQMGKKTSFPGITQCIGGGVSRQ